MITNRQYASIKNLQASNLKLWLDKNNFTFHELREAAYNYIHKNDYFKNVSCTCCGAPQEGGVYHTKECIWKTN